MREIRYTKRALQKLEVLARGFDARDWPAYRTKISGLLELCASLPPKSKGIGRNVRSRKGVRVTRHDHTWLYYRITRSTLTLVNIDDTRSWRTKPVTD